MPTTHFSEKSKKIIKEMCNVELFKLCEANPETQCKECLLYWNQGIVCCTCGHLLNESEASRGAIQCTLDFLSIQNYVIKKGRPHVHRFGKTKEQKDHHIAHNLRKRCIKRNFEGIHVRFQKDLRFRDSQLRIDRTERGGEERFHLSHVVRRVYEIQKDLVYLSQHIWTKCTNETPIRLQRSINKDAPSSP